MAKITKICKNCDNEFETTTFAVGNYCSRKCCAISRGKKQRGENNPNFGGKYTKDPVIYARMVDGCKKRGQAWDDAEKKRHSKRMLGPSNAMRGTKHKPETIEKICKTKKQQYKDGVVKITPYKISKAEKEITQILRDNNITVVQQYHIKDVSFIYDFYLPDFNILIEYQGTYWHADPDKYKSGTMLKMRHKGLMSVDEIWKRDKIKKELAEQNGYKLIEIKESDYIKLKENLILQIIEKIKNDK